MILRGASRATAASPPTPVSTSVWKIPAAAASIHTSAEPQRRGAGRPKLTDAGKQLAKKARLVLMAQESGAEQLVFRTTLIHRPVKGSQQTTLSLQPAVVLGVGGPAVRLTTRTAAPFILPTSLLGAVVHKSLAPDVDISFSNVGDDFFEQSTVALGDKDALRMRYDMATRVAGQIAVADMKLQDRIQKACALVIAGTTPNRCSAEYNVDQRRHVLGVLDASLGNVSQSMRLLKAIGGAYSTLSRSTISLWVSARSSGESLDPKTRGKAALPEEFLYDIRDNYCITAAREDWIVGDSGRHERGVRFERIASCATSWRVVRAACLLAQGMPKWAGNQAVQKLQFSPGWIGWFLHYFGTTSRRVGRYEKPFPAMSVM